MLSSGHRPGPVRRVSVHYSSSIAQLEKRLLLLRDRAGDLERVHHHTIMTTVSQGAYDSFIWQNGDL